MMASQPDPEIPVPIEPADPAPSPEPETPVQPAMREIGGRDGPDPVRYGDWEKGGVAVDF